MKMAAKIQLVQVDETTVEARFTSTGEVGGYLIGRRGARKATWVEVDYSGSKPRLGRETKVNRQEMIEELLAVAS